MHTVRWLLIYLQSQTRLEEEWEIASLVLLYGLWIMKMGGGAADNDG